MTLNETQFIKKYTDTLNKLELLVFLSDNPSTMDTSESISIWSGIPVAEIQSILEGWLDAGLVRCEGNVFHFTAPENLGPVISQVVQTYKSTRRLFRSELARINEQRQEDKKVHRKALAIAAGKTDTLLQSIADAVLMVDSARSITHSNRVFRESFPGFQPQVLPSSLETAFTREDIRQLITDLLAGGEGVFNHCLDDRHYEIVVTSIKDEHGSTILDPDQRPIGHVLVFKDISARMKIERMKEDLSKMITHDLRSPMTGIFTAFDLILKDARDALPDNLYKSCVLGKRTSQFLLEMVNDLLDVHKIEDGSIPIMLAPISIQEIIGESLDQISPLAMDRQIRIEKSLPQQPLSLSGDPQKLIRVFVNLLTNALKFTPKKKSIQISHEVTDCSFTDSPVDKTDKTRCLIISIKDEGHGIPAENLPYIFEKYYRTQQTPKAFIAGTGLGLYFCKLIIKAHHGDIRVESKPGQGSTFSVLLPLSEQ